MKAKCYLILTLALSSSFPICAQTRIQLNAQPQAVKSTLSTADVSNLTREIQNTNKPINELVQADHLQQGIRAYFNLQANLPIGGPPTSIAAQKIGDLTRSGFLSDSRYLTNALASLISVRVVGPTQPDILHPDCVAVGSSNEFCCSGTLIAPQLVITAGH